MAARPPGGGSSEPDAIEFGIAVLDERVEEAGVSFPATIRLSEALEQVPQTEFENETEFLDALYPVFDRERREGGGVLASLRDALPF